MESTRTLLILCFVYFNCASAYKIPVKGKCSIHDDSCQINLYGGVIQDAAESGIPDLDIPVLDPYVHKGIEITIMNLITLKGSEIIIKGLKNCQITKFHTDMKRKAMISTYNCKVITVEGKYHIQTTPVLNALTNNVKINGDGYGTVKIENLVIKSEVPFALKKLSDGELHFEVQGDEITYKYDILGKTSVTLDNLVIGSQDISAVAAAIINENAQFFVKTYGNDLFRMAIKVFEENANKFHRAYSAKDLYLEDLSAYAT